MPRIRPATVAESLDWLRHVHAANLTRRRPDGHRDVAKATVVAVAGIILVHVDGPAGDDPGGRAWPGDDAIARDLDVSPRVVRRAIGALLAGGYLVRQQRGREGRRAVYALALPRHAAERSRSPRCAICGGPGGPLCDGCVGTDSA